MFRGVVHDCHFLMLCTWMMMMMMMTTTKTTMMMFHQSSYCVVCHGLIGVYIYHQHMYRPSSGKNVCVCVWGGGGCMWPHHHAAPPRAYVTHAHAWEQMLPVDRSFSRS